MYFYTAIAMLITRLFALFWSKLKPLLYFDERQEVHNEHAFTEDYIEDIFKDYYVNNNRTDVNKKY